MTLDAYRTDVSVRMLTIYGIDWADACGDDEPLMRAMEYGETPEEFVDWFGRKFDLDPLWLFGLKPDYERIAKLSQTTRGSSSD